MCFSDLQLKTANICILSACLNCCMFSKKHLLLFSVYVIGNDYLAVMIS